MWMVHVIEMRTSRRVLAVPAAPLGEWPSGHARVGGCSRTNRPGSPRRARQLAQTHTDHGHGTSRFGDTRLGGESGGLGDAPLQNEELETKRATTIPGRHVTAPAYVRRSRGPKCRTKLGSGSEAVGNARSPILDTGTRVDEGR